MTTPHPNAAGMVVLAARRVHMKAIIHSRYGNP